MDVSKAPILKVVQEDDKVIEEDGRLYRGYPEAAPRMASLERALSRPPRCRSPARLRVFFLRRLRLCGEVMSAARLAGVPLSTLYRWRDRDEAFRRRWDQTLAMRQQLLEDALMALALHGERREVFYRSEMVGLRNYRNPRALILLLQHLGRQKAAV